MQLTPSSKFHKALIAAAFVLVPLCAHANSTVCNKAPFGASWAHYLQFSLDLSKTEALALRAELKAARRKFTKAGGRGVDLAEFIDCARFELRSRAARKAAQTRAAKKT